MKSTMPEMTNTAVLTSLDIFIYLSSLLLKVSCNLHNCHIDMLQNIILCQFQNLCSHAQI